MIENNILKENRNPAPIIETPGGQDMTTKYSSMYPERK
jgi:hypothetical protein